MKLKVGDVLVKKRGGATKRVKVLWISWDVYGQSRVREALVTSLAPSNSRDNNARQWWVPLGDDGLPEGYKRAEVSRA